MAKVVREVREEPVATSPATVKAEQNEYTMTVLERLVYFVGGVIMALIALRILLSILGANRGNGFASFIYNASYPFVAPFFGLFNYRMQYGVSRFEFESLVALIVWALITAAVARLVVIGSRRRIV